MFLNILQVSLEKKTVLGYHFNPADATLLKRDSNTGSFLRSFRIFKNTFFWRVPPVAASYDEYGNIVKGGSQTLQMETKQYSSYYGWK